MKCNILTLHDANNVGAFMQAYSLQYFLEQNKIQSNFIKFAPTGNNSKISKALKIIKSLKFNYLLYKYKTSKRYNLINDKLNLDSEYFDENKKYNNLIIGSDEVWNIESKTFTHHPQYFGNNIKSNKIISYAPSANISKVDTFKELNINFDKFTNISVRDENTYDIVNKISGIDPTLVCDPTLLVKEYDYMLKKEYSVDDSNFILVYSYGLTNEEIKYVKSLAKAMNKKLYSFGTYNSWCDKSIVVDPFEFMCWLENADFVVTSTFHGTILSLKLNKEMLIFPQKSEKIKYVIKQFKLDDRTYSKDLLLKDLITEKMNYKKINSDIDKLRKISTEFLINSINK